MTQGHAPVPHIQKTLARTRLGAAYRCNAAYNGKAGRGAAYNETAWRGYVGRHAAYNGTARRGIDNNDTARRREDTAG